MKQIVALFLIILSHHFISAADKIIPIPKSTSDILVEQRLNRIFFATDWYPNLNLDVKEGVVFLNGTFRSKDKKNWALNLIDRTEGVVATIDKTELELEDSSAISPARQELNVLSQKVNRHLPYVISGIVVLILFLLFAYLTKKFIFVTMTHRNSNVLLTQAIASISGIIVLLLGLYLAFRTSGLSGLAITVLGGTGVLGIAIALALKGTVENYASGLMIGLRKLFRSGEIVNINGFEGVVQSVSTRGTTLMDYEGNNIIIPNKMIFESVIKNLTRNPNMRADFVVGIGYSDSINEAKKIILDTIKSFPDIFLTDPEPIVTTDTLAAATVNLRIYFWFNAVKHTKLKVKSLLTQMVKENLMRSNISLPDDSREIIFASPLQIINSEESKSEGLLSANTKRKESRPNSETTIDLKNEIEELKDQANKAEPAELGKNILVGGQAVKG